MMCLSHHNTVTGGTTHGRCTVHRPTVPPAGVPGFHQPDPRRVSAARSALRDRVPNPYGGMADGWETADRTPVYRLQKLPSADTRRPALVHLGLPENSRFAQIWRYIPDCAKLWACMKYPTSSQSASTTFRCGSNRYNGWVCRRCSTLISPPMATGPVSAWAG